MTKEVFASSSKKAISIVGGILSGGITYLSFRPCCDKLKKSFQDTILSDPHYKPVLEDEMIINEIEETE